jgi:DNA polymerase-4
MRGANRPGRTVTLRLRFDDFGRATRSRSLLKATMQTRAVLETARALLAEARPLIETRGLTLVGLAVSNLDGDGAVQPPLPFQDPFDDRLDVAVDAVRDRFGSASLTRATSLGRDLGPSVPILPD